MKTRTGFVSNSSSSSFIVNFTKDPTDINNLREMMGDCGTNPYGTAISTEEVIKAVHADIMSQQNYKKEAGKYPFEIDEWDLQNDAEQLLHNANFYYEDVNGKSWDEAVEEMEEEIKQFRLKMWLKLTGKTVEQLAEESKFQYMFTFSDECGSFWAAMEHGDVFRNVEHTMRSNH